MRESGVVESLGIYCELGTQNKRRWMFSYRWYVFKLLIYIDQLTRCLTKLLYFCSLFFKNNVYLNICLYTQSHFNGLTLLFITVELK